MSIWTLLVFVCGTRAQNLSAPFSYTLYIPNFMTTRSGIQVLLSLLPQQLQMPAVLVLQMGGICEVCP
jgi:hypothetical protein